MMSSANRLLLQRLSNTSTLQRIFRRSANPQSSRVVHLNQLLSLTVAQINVLGGGEEYPSTSTHIKITAGIVGDAIAKDDVALPLEMNPAYNTVNKDGVSPEKVIRTGTIGWIHFGKMFGILIQDSQYHNIGPLKQENVFFHFAKIYPEIKMNEDIQLEPVIDLKKRFQFQARKHSKKEGVLEAFNLRYEGGDDIPLIHWTGSLVLIKKAKATLGHDIYDILSKSSEKDAKQVARKVDDAISTCNKRVVWAKEQITNPRKAAMERKARFGNEIYELLWNIARVDNIQQRTDDAYNRCLEDLSALGLTETNHGKELGFDEFFEVGDM